MIDLWALDEGGFAPTLPTGYGWGRRGARPAVPYEAPQGRRVNVGGAPAPYAAGGPRPRFETRRKAVGRYDAAAHLAFVDRVAAAGTPGRPCVVVLGNYAVHRSRAVGEAAPAPAERGVTSWHPPPYSPQPNPIEAVRRQVKRQDLPVRSHPTEAAPQSAVEAAPAHRAEELTESTHDLPRSA